MPLCLVLSQSPSFLGIQVSPNQPCNVEVEVGFNATLHEEYGAPSKVLIRYDIDPREPKVNITESQEKFHAPPTRYSQNPFTRDSFFEND